MGFHNFKLNIPSNIRNVFHVDKLRAISKDLLFSQVSNDNHPGPTIIGNKNETHEYDVEKIPKEKKRGPWLLRPQSQTGKVCRERLPKFALGSLGKRSMERWERSAH